jgi:hypothetical protein
VIVAKLRRYLCEQRVKARPVFPIAQTQRLSLGILADERGQPVLIALEKLGTEHRVNR